MTCTSTQDLFYVLKNIDQRTKDIVIGYIKQCQLLLPQNNTYYNIPSLVRHLCMAYYLIKEYFTKHSKDIELNENGSIATNTASDFRSAYGNIVIDGELLMIYKWWFKILRASVICIGIDSSNKKHIDVDYSNPEINYCNFGAYYCGGKKYGHDLAYNGVDYGDAWGEDEVIKMELNTKKRTLQFHVNDKNQGIAFKDIDFKNKTYHMAIAMYGEQDSLELIDFQQISNR